MEHLRFILAFRRALAFGLGLLLGLTVTLAQGTAFTYQGQLTDGAAAANGTYDLRFTLWNAATVGAQQGATLTQDAVGVTNGLFTATLDFGAQFNGQNRWLEIAVRTNGAADFTTLAERQPVLPTPYAIHAATAGSAATATTATTVTGTVPASQLTGTLSAAQIPNLNAGKITGGVFTGNGWGLTNVPLSALVQLNNPVVVWGDNASGQTNVPDGLGDVVAISAGDAHSLALKAGGTVVAWGDNSFRQANVPAGLSGVVAVAAGRAHSLALKSDGTVVAWGAFGFDYGQASVPYGLGDVVAISAGQVHSLALKADGTVVAWGDSSNGRTNVPAALNGVVAISAGYDHSLALKADGTVVAWGGSFFGQVNVPSGLSGVVTVAAGYYFSVALKADGTVVAWGASGPRTAVPAALSGVVAISAGWGHSLALKADGSVVAWGLSGRTSIPDGLGGVVAVAAGGNHSMVLKAGKASPASLARLDQANVFLGAISAHSFTGNGSGLTNLNASALTTGTVPVAQVPNLDASKVTTGTFSVARIPPLAASQIPNLDASKITSGTFTGNGSGLTSLNASALTTGTVPMARVPDLDAGKVTTGTFATGRIPILTAGQIPNLDASKITSGTFAGDGSGLTSLNASALTAGAVPVAHVPNLDAGKITSGVLSPDRIPTLDASKISGGAFFGDGTGLTNIPLSALVGPKNKVVAWGLNSAGATDVAENLSGVVAVAAGDYHSLALKSDGTVIGWGATSVPAGLNGVKGVSAGWDHSLAVLTNGTVSAWGDNLSGQTDVPVGLTGVTAVAAGGSLSLALKTDGTVVAWGWDYQGQTNVPPGLTAVTAVAAGGHHCLALKSDGTVVAWGEGTSGQTSVPAGLTGVVAVSAGWNHSLALKSDGTVVVWGSGNKGQLSVPNNLTGVLQISAGEDFNLALKEDGTVVGWGTMDSSPVAIPPGLPKVVGLAGGWHHSLVICEGGNPANLARLDQSNAFQGSISAAAFSGNGSGLTNLDASALTAGAVPVARIPNLDASKIASGTLGDARLSANVALLNGSPAFTSSVRLADTNLFLRGGSDTNHGLAWFAGSRSFAGATVDGPVLYGFLGGALGSTKTAAKIALRWNDSADVSLGGDLTITNSLSVNSPVGAQAASITGTRTGNHNSPLVLVENKETSTGSSPSLRVIGRGGADEGALSVTANAGPIARFGNALNWVATIENNGNLSLSGTVNPPSDRNVKAGFAPVDVEAVLAKVALLPLTTWHYTNDAAATPHLGPMAQDFHAAFGLGGNDKTIATVDADGVALAAIQGLHRKVEELAAENVAMREHVTAQRAENTELRARLERLEALLLNRESQGN